MSLTYWQLRVQYPNADDLAKALFDRAAAAVEAMRMACFDAVTSNPGDKDALTAILKIDAAALILGAIPNEAEAAAWNAMSTLRQLLDNKVSTAQAQDA